MLKLRAALLLGSILFISCVDRSRLVSISAYRLDQTANIDSLNRITGRVQWQLCCSGDNSLAAAGFINNFAAYRDFLPVTAVIWAAGGKNSGPCRTSLHPGFVEVISANAEDEENIRISMKKWVPPIIFQSPNAADFLSMWHAISGMEFRYDPELLQNSLNYDRARLLEESDPELYFIEIPKVPFPSNEAFPSGLVQFVSSKKTDVADFMPLLAAHVGGLARDTFQGWVIEKFQRNKQGLQLIEDCIDQIERDPFPGPSDSVEILSRIGKLALPELLREFQPTVIDRDIKKQVERTYKFEFVDARVEVRLIAILSRISSPQRDEALLSALKNGWGDVPAIMQALASSNCQPAVPILEQIAINPKSLAETRLAARIALNALGRPSAPPEQEQGLDLIPSVQSVLKTDRGKQAMALLRAVLSQCDKYKSGMQLKYADIDSTYGIVFSGNYPDRSGWTFEVPILRANRALVRFSYVCGRLCGEGFWGRLEKRNGCWLVTRWRQLWTS